MHQPKALGETGRRVRFYMALGLVAAATLMLQIIETRIISVVSWYHLAFFVINIAMFGLTAGAVFVYLRSERFARTVVLGAWRSPLTYLRCRFWLPSGPCRSRRPLCPYAGAGRGVLAASVALVTSIAFSIDTTLRIGAACYLSWSPLQPYCWCSLVRDPTIQHQDLCTPKARMCRIGQRGDRLVRVVDTLVCRLRRLRSAIRAHESAICCHTRFSESF
jgi:hypothetical protein